MCVSRTKKVFLKSLTASHTKCMFSEKCNSYRIAIQWFHVNQYLGIPYTKFQPYTCRVLGLGFFKRYAILVPRLYAVVSTWRAFLCLSMPTCRIGCVILAWHSLSLSYNHLDADNNILFYYIQSSKIQGNIGEL